MQFDLDMARNSNNPSSNYTKTMHPKYDPIISMHGFILPILLSGKEYKALIPSSISTKHNYKNGYTSTELFYIVFIA